MMTSARRPRLFICSTLIVLFATAATLLAACGSEGEQQSSTSGNDLQLVIGYPAALSGPYACYDVPYLHGMEFAEKQINENGGLDGVEVKIETCDTKSDQSLAMTQVQKMLDDDVGVFVLTMSEVSTGIGVYVTQQGAIASVGGNSAPRIVYDLGPRGFMLNYGDNVQAAGAADYCLEKGYKTAYVIGSPDNLYTKLIPLYFEDAYETGGGKVVVLDKYKVGQVEYGALVTKIKTTEPAPDVIFTPMFVPDFGAFMKQLRSAGVTTPVVTTDGNDTSFLVESAGESVDGVVITTDTFLGNDGLPNEFLRDYRDLMGQAPESNILEALGRDQVYCIAQAAANAGSVDPDEILAALQAMKDYPMVTGAYTYNPECPVPSKPITLVEMDGTEFTFLETFVPAHIPDPVVW